MKVKKLRMLLLFTFVFLFFGCASAFMAGSQPHSGIPGSPIAAYKIQTCKHVSDGSSIDGPRDTMYYLARTDTGLVLYELDSKGNGAAITNYWKDENGMNFLTYVKTSHGWQYVIPEDKTKPAVRQCFVRGTFRVQDVDGVMKVTSGSPTYNCEMMPQ